MPYDVVFYVDGLCEPINPKGVACYGWVGYFGGEKMESGYGVVGEGEGMTNNVAEYHSLISAMKYIVELGYIGKIEFRSDSQLIVNQMSGNWKINKEYLQKLNDQAQELAKNFVSVSYKWIPREENEEADALSRKAYNTYRRNKK